MGDLKILLKAICKMWWLTALPLVVTILVGRYFGLIESKQRGV